MIHKPQPPKREDYYVYDNYSIVAFDQLISFIQELKDKKLDLNTVHFSYNNDKAEVEWNINEKATDKAFENAIKRHKQDLVEFQQDIEKAYVDLLKSRSSNI